MKYFVVLFIASGALALPRPGVHELPAQPSGSYLPGLSSSIKSSDTLYTSLPAAALQSSAALLPSLASSLIGTSSSASIVGQSLVDSGLGGFNGYSNGYVEGNLHQDQKHVYFYSAPEDEPAARLRIYVEPTSQRHTKVIFIKAPSYGGVIPEVIAPPSEAVDRTKVYVLVKRPEGGSITVPTSLGVKQAKPEVFFIKYDNQHEAEAAINQGLQGGHVGTPVENLGNEHVFTRTLGGAQRGGIAGGLASGYSASSVAGGVSLAGAVVQNRQIGAVGYGPAGESGPYKK